MLRASSEIAVATSVASLAEKPFCSANVRPLRRATTRSASDATEIRMSKLDSHSANFVISGFPFEVRDAPLEIQSGRNVFQRYPELNHGKGDFRLNTDDHRLGATQSHHVGDVA